MQRLRLELSGMVQGVGFRPFVYRVAQELGVSGFIRNTGSGVALEIEGEAPSMQRFLARLDAELPPHAVIEDRKITPLSPNGERGFAIVASEATGGQAMVPADFALCADCRREIDDPQDRRYRYPFTSCVNCGPRYSIVAAMPYDRARTAMRDFPFCAACQAEYDDPACRRFHAEASACPICGPQLAWWDTGGRVLATCDGALSAAAAALRDGGIVALKGLGGFQLLTVASDEAAVQRLRLAKQRPRKAFAVMVPSLAAAERLTLLSDLERRLLLSPAAPIVLARARQAAPPLVAPGNPWLGIMLPTTALHHLLLAELGVPIVATSGNPGGEPIVADEEEALRSLGGIADYFLVHDRPILRSLDDSVVRVIAGQAVVLRRARGYTPLAIAHAAAAKPIISLGGQQKNAVALGAGGRILLGPHIGDLAGPAARARFGTMIKDWPQLHGVTPGVVACDTHPDYYTTRAALAQDLPVIRVPHHLAHILAAMADHGIEGPVLGIAWDGTGHGADGTIWGGEFLTVGQGRFRREGHLHPFRLPGGDAAIREPRRAALGVLYEIFGAAAFEQAALDAVASFSASERQVLKAMLQRGLQAPLSSSAGRLFDAVASLLGLCQIGSFEGEAAMEVEFAADRAAASCRLPPPVIRDDGGRLVVDWRPMLEALIAAHHKHAAVTSLAAAFHDGLASAMLAMAEQIGVKRVVLTGGCFQNAVLTERAVQLLRAAGFEVYWHHRIPPNDGGLAAGQIAFAANPLVEETY